MKATRYFAIVVSTLSLLLSACIVEMPDRDPSQATLTWFPQIGTDERDFHSICSHFGNETPFSQKPYHRC
jgi:hypothetical protein